MRKRPLSGLPAAADAMAQGDTIGVGGWYSLTETPKEEAVFWFMEKWAVADFPDDWSIPAEAQKAIACLETLAQMALTKLRAHLVQGASQEVVYRQDCDNSPAEGSANRLFSNRARSSTSSRRTRGSWGP